MTEHRRDSQTETPGGKPSQAEGERRDSASERRTSQTETPGGKPSQAEGDRETVDEELGEK